MIKIEVVLEQEQLEELFENVEVKMTKKKLKELKMMIEETAIDIQEQLEETLKEIIEETISDEWEK